MARGVPSSGNRSPLDDNASPKWSFKLSMEGSGASTGPPAWLWWFLGVSLSVAGIFVTWGLAKGWF